MRVHQGRQVIFVDDLVGHQQIAERTQLTDGAIHKWRQRFDDFPAPIADVGGESHHYVWDWVQVEKFLDDHPRLRRGLSEVNDQGQFQQRPKEWAE